MSKPHSIKITTGDVPPGEYLQALHHAITELLKLVFSHRELDLFEEHIEGLYVLADLLQRIMSKPDSR